MKLTKEQDARICAEYGVTPGRWAADNGVYAYRGEGIED